MNNFTIQLVIKLLSLPSILIALTIHECAHGYAAYKLGDPTAKITGRLSINPLRHLDPIGFLCMLIFGFGWAKPVPINTRYFKNPKRDMALSSLAGPVSNLLLAFAGTFVYRVVYAVINTTGADFYFSPGYFLLVFLQMFCTLNIGLGIFNMLPIPPLDGSRVFLTLLPQKLYFGIMKYENYIMIAMFILIFAGSRFGLVGGTLGWLIDKVFSGYNAVFDLIPFLR
jgi:Zn-dependent protease